MLLAHQIASLDIMTSTHGPDHRHHGRHSHGTHDHDGTDIGALLELDAAVTGTYLAEAISLIRTEATRPIEVIVDAGAGTGVGTRALAAAFGDAEIVAIDGSPEMTARIDAAGPGTVRTVTADLDAGWPASVGTTDVVWASASLHHIANPAAFLRTTRSHLRPGGVLAVIEMPHQPRFLHAEPPHADLGDRIEELMRAKGANSFPDWTDTITAAGFEMRTRHTVSIDVPEPTALTRAYAQAWLSRVRTGLADDLTDTDAATLDELLGDGPTSLRCRPDLAVRAARTIWIATVPASTTETNQEIS
ncbi:class I SAM-dependent methyltransferase [Gordonia polyisoprenivorans]|nr:class I SAM-dependent methyltransferase [Gordonia polyisoprenivorans]